MPGGLGNFPLVGLILVLAIAVLAGGRSSELVVQGVFGQAREDDDDAGATRPP